MSAETPAVKKFKGIIPPIVTPLRDRSQLDVKGTERLVNRIVGGGAHGIFALGTTGEAPSLDASTKRELLRRVCEFSAGRVPVLAGITDASFIESLKLAEFAAACGAQALVLAPPYYFPAGQAELLEYLEHLAPRLPLPLMLYNMPAMTKLEYAPETLAKAFEMPGVIGLKDSSGKMPYLQKALKLARKRPDLSVMVGPEELLAEAVLFGADGGVCGGANVFPELYVKLYEAAAKHDLERSLALHEKVLHLGELLYGVGRFASSGIKGIKCALSCLGVCEDFMAEPFHRFREPERTAIAKAVEILEKELADAL
jgi:4-hydroxy-tetrahydrodipicolinate synthase